MDSTRASYQDIRFDRKIKFLDKHNKTLLGEKSICSTEEMKTIHKAVSIGQSHQGYSR